MELFNNELVSVTINGQTFEINKMLYHFIEIQKIRNEDISNISQLINEFSNFLDYWTAFQYSKADEMYENKHLEKFQLYHTIKPNTQYAHQQQIANGQAIHYPIHRFDAHRLHSMACGGNYPIGDCELYVREQHQLIKISLT